MNTFEPLALMHVRGLPQRRDQPTARDWANVLATFPLFSGVSRRRLRKLARNATFAEFARGETIIFPGDRSNVLYVIISGKAESGSRHSPRRLRTGDYFGELAVIGGRARSATVVATSELHVMKLTACSVRKLAREHPAVTLTMLESLITQVRRLEAQGARAA